MENSQNKNKNSQKQIETNIGLGSIVATMAHPFFKEGEKLYQPKITAWNGFIPPLMVVIEERKSKKFNEKTGEKESNSFKCLYFSNKKENYEEYWFKEAELKLIASTDNNQLKEELLSELKKDWIGKSVILKTVDLELGKKQLYQDGNENRLVFKQKSLLDFLPPLSTVIQVSRVEEYKKHDEKTGDLLFKKGSVLVKLRWFNGKSLKYSEQEIPLHVLKKVEPIGEVTLEKGDAFVKILEDPMTLEDYPSVVIKAIPVSFNDIVFQHYRYQYRFKNKFNNTWEIQNEEGNLEPLKDLTDFDPSFRKTKALDPYKYQNGAWTGKWFKIAYLDVGNRFTQRIIVVREVISFYNEEHNKMDPVMLEANCLLRNGKIRHFKVERIMRSEEMSEKFRDLFLNNVEEKDRL